MNNAFYPDTQPARDRVRRALREIDARDGDVQAFVCHADAASPPDASAGGPLHGLAIGVKDIIDVAGMPTLCGARAMDDVPKAFDAACVAQLRAAGAVPVGKTVTAEFAYMTPGPTRNPHRLDHTPGGSSSGSAAAVAAGMVDMAIGTQTGGSIIRPAAFCGVVGVKPTFGRVHRGGMQVLCDSLDTIGWFTRTAEQSVAIASVLFDDAPANTQTAAHAPARAPAGAPDNAATNASPQSTRSPKVALLPCATLGTLTPAGQCALQDCVARLEAGGATVVRPQLDGDIDELFSVHAQVMRYEIARGIAPVVRQRADRVSPAILEVMKAGLAIGHGHYVSQQRRRAEIAARWQDRFAGVDFIVTPSAPGEAPAGLATTGTSVFNRIWSLLGWPCVQLPTATGEFGLPVGVQWVGKPDTDMALLGWAAALHAQVDGRGQ